MARYGQSCKVVQVETKPECLSSGGLLGEVGSPSEASHHWVSHSSFQQPHPRSRSHCCAGTRQAPRRTRASQARLMVLAAGFRLLGGDSPVPHCFLGSSCYCFLMEVLLESISFPLQCNGSADIFPRPYLSKGGEPPCCLWPPAYLPQASHLRAHSHI